MRTKIIIVVLGLLVVNCNNSGKTQHGDLAHLEKDIIIETPLKKTTSQNAEIVFCLDATGSMSGLIGTAKEKIWDIASEMAQSNDIDTLKIGMVFYRDKGDHFITKQVPLNTDLDETYTDLLDISAQGGGDTPESVNKALYESVTNMQWALEGNTYKTVFLVGDCPPHMDYQDDVKYTETCKLAAEKGIVINTIKLGNSCKSAVSHFKNIANCSGGEFLQLDQNARDYVVATPYDEEINTLSKEVDDTRMYYGTEKERTDNYSKKSKSLEVYDKGSTTANSSRVKFKQSKVGRKFAYGTQEIISDYEDGKLNVKTIKEEQLPESLKGKTIAEKEQIIKDLAKKRAENNKRIQALIEKKNDYIKANKANQKDSTSFSKEVITVLNKQSKKVKS